MSSKDFNTIRLETSRTGIYTLRLNRPEVHNAFNELMIEEISSALEQLKEDTSIRVLCVKGTGRSFCAGADLNWMQRSSHYASAENYHDAMQMAQMMYALYSFPRPTVATVHGAVFGGGVGLVACCDIVISDQSAKFSLSEVKLGLIPSVIGPYVVNAIGPRVAKRYFLTGERFDAATARSTGLVHECGDSQAIPEIESRILDELLSSGPAAQFAAKSLISNFLTRQIDDELQMYTARLISIIRASQEGQEGVEAFLAKRHPNWRTSESD